MSSRRLTRVGHDSYVVRDTIHDYNVRFRLHVLVVSQEFVLVLFVSSILFTSRAEVRRIVEADHIFCVIEEVSTVSYSAVRTTLALICPSRYELIMDEHLWRHQPHQLHPSPTLTGGGRRIRACIDDHV